MHAAAAAGSPHHTGFSSYDSAMRRSAAEVAAAAAYGRHHTHHSLAEAAASESLVLQHSLASSAASVEHQVNHFRHSASFNYLSLPHLEFSSSSFPISHFCSLSNEQRTKRMTTTSKEKKELERNRRVQSWESGAFGSLKTFLFFLLSRLMNFYLFNTFFTLISPHILS